MKRKTTKAAIKAVETAKKEKVKKDARKKASEEAKKLSKELGVSLEEADLYLKKEARKTKRKEKIKGVLKRGAKIAGGLQAFAQQYEYPGLVAPKTKKQSNTKTKKKPKKNRGSDIVANVMGDFKW